jgi:hypothetical protein
LTDESLRRKAKNFSNIWCFGAEVAELKARKDTTDKSSKEEEKNDVE